MIQRLLESGTRLETAKGGIYEPFDGTFDHSDSLSKETFEITYRCSNKPSVSVVICHLAVSSTLDKEFGWRIQTQFS